MPVKHNERPIVAAMKSTACIVLLETKLVLDKERVKHMLHETGVGLVAELLERKELSVKGLGAFRVAHIPFCRKRMSDATRIMPPAKSIVFQTKPVIDSRVQCIIREKTKLSQTEAAAFYRILAAYFRESFAKKKDIVLDGLGSFRDVEGRYRFVPDDVLLEIVNSEYRDLPAFDLPKV